MSTAELLLVTSHGRLSLNAEDNDTVLEVLQKNEIPWSAVTIYQEDQGELKLTPCLEKQVHDLENKKYYVYYSRNIHPFAARVMNLNIINNDNTEAATEYIYQKYNNEAGQIENYLKPLNPDECKEIIAKNVHEFIRNNIIEGATIVVGISGGGDSNALLHGLTTFKEYKIN
ncbi:MAG: hypothetical protein KDD37_11640, partial [Bdellovibrionales bacterium]|nr:hypothetical protein [Bdellovibrionales bacterium]